jgi:hypothetical protein
MIGSRGEPLAVVELLEVSVIRLVTQTSGSPATKAKDFAASAHEEFWKTEVLPQSPCLSNPMTKPKSSLRDSES